MIDAPEEQFERTRLPQLIARRLEQSIREGRFLPGQRLPSERVLSEELGVSRPVLREALRLLKEGSLVRTERGSGTFVRDLSAEFANANPAEWLAAHIDEVREFYRARLLIEPECAALAAERRTQLQLTVLKQLLDAAEEVLRDGRRSIVFSGLDIDFHTCIAEMSGSRSLQRMLAAIIGPETDLRQVLHRVPGRLEVSQSRHRRIAQAIEGRDSGAAREAMQRALQGTVDDIDGLLKGGDRQQRSTAS